MASSKPRCRGCGNGNVKPSCTGCEHSFADSIAAWQKSIKPATISRHMKRLNSLADYDQYDEGSW